MIALMAFKVAVVAYAATIGAWLVLLVRIAMLDVLERHIGTLNGEYVMNKYPSLFVITLVSVVALAVAGVATIVAAIAWAVGA